MSDLYDASSQHVQYRRDVAKSLGVGFEVPKTLAANHSKAGEEVLTGANGRFSETMETEAIPC